MCGLTLTFTARRPDDFVDVVPIPDEQNGVADNEDRQQDDINDILLVSIGGGGGGDDVLGFLHSSSGL